MSQDYTQQLKRRWDQNKQVRLSIGLDKKGYPVNIFSYFSTKTYVVGTHLKRLVEALLMSTTTYVFVEK